MKQTFKCAIVMIILTAISTNAWAQNACDALQQCVFNAVPAVVDSCSTEAPNCANPDRFGATAEELAQRSLTNNRCPRTRTKAQCNSCYQAAKEPFRNRFDGRIFHGMLAQAIRVIEAERRVVCPTKGRSSSTSSSSSSGTSSSTSSSGSSHSSSSSSSRSNSSDDSSSSHS